MTSTDSYYSGELQPQYPPPPQPWVPQPLPQPRVINLQLPPFWTERPMSWFATVEARFQLNGIHDEQVRFDLLVNALP